MPFTAVHMRNFPDFDMLPAIVPTSFPFESGSFKPFLHARIAAVEGTGILVNFAVYENAATLPIAQNTADQLQNCCASISLCPFPEVSARYINVTGDIFGGFTGKLCAGQEQIDDLTGEITADFTPLTQGGSNEIGYYWGLTFLLSDRLLDRLYGTHSLTPASVMRGNIYILCHNPAMEHFGSVSPITDLQNRTPYRCDGFADIPFISL